MDSVAVAVAASFNRRVKLDRETEVLPGLAPELVALDADWWLLSASQDVCHARRQLGTGIVGRCSNRVLAIRTRGSAAG
ncbi:MAG TPA: hypothetical protein VKZ59_13015, partial [Acidobacteriota bacterium]|nr:hypothetical protein [Acidobacteriota bacterium]